VLEPEVLGTKLKFWYRRTDKARRWLFKYPQPNTGQHWSEKIAAEIAALMGIPHAKVELAEFGGERGSATQTFILGRRELWHGNQVLAGKLFGYNSESRFRHSEHTLENILKALGAAFARERFRRIAKGQIALYLVLDAVIGNTDRHHENWGIVRERTRSGLVGYVAPTFDHASSLGRELKDQSDGQCRKRVLERKEVPKYAQGGRGAIYWSSADSKGPSPLQLVRQAKDQYPDLFQPAISRVNLLSKEQVDQILLRMPPGWMSSIAMDFVREFLAYSVSELLKLQE
jgi:hypothetical protein